MAEHQFSTSALIHAPPERVYAIIADYRDAHPRILPKPYFVSLTVEKGGTGAGTVIRFQMKTLGRLQDFRGEISEPEPGRVIAETYAERGMRTSFTVEPRDNGAQAYVTIATSMQVPDGIAGKIQGWFTTRLILPVYEKELAQLDAVAQQSPAAP